jgi:phosphohistidine phosphatase
MKEIPDHFYRQSAVLPVRRRAGRAEILLITSRKRTRWVLPKGVVDPGLSAAASAAKEALEEAGILGRIDPTPLGTYSYSKWGGICDVEVYSMAVTQQLDDWAESHRDRQWLSPREAAARVEEPALKALILQCAEPDDDASC